MTNNHVPISYCVHTIILSLKTKTKNNDKDIDQNPKQNNNKKKKKTFGNYLCESYFSDKLTHVLTIVFISQDIIKHLKETPNELSND